MACFGFGISCIVRARLGLAPWDVFHQGLSDLTGLSLGLMIEGMGLLILLLWIPLRQRPGLGTIVLAFGIGPIAHFTIPRLSLPPIANEPPVTVH